jgi:glycosyltransferase involved in cell wall biosynthesis
MKTPTVSFVVPCYKLGHLLAECVNSILAQTYSDFEVLIMDDCSPDDTMAIAASFHDPRVEYIRNESNIGHLRNYNKGIQLSRGKYVWLISADDYLRRPYVLERYIQLMEKHVGVGFSFCPGVGVNNHEETSVLSYSVIDKNDHVINGRLFLERLINQNIVIAASVMARRECYEHAGFFPLDAVWAGRHVEMGWVGDWYLWCVFSLSFDVAYFAEPMVCYREHDMNMTATITHQGLVDECAVADVAVPWMIKQQADKSGFANLSKRCLVAVAREYARQAASKGYRSCEFSLSINQFENSLRQSTINEKERKWIRARFFEGLGGRHWLQRDLRSASICYLRALQNDPRLLRVYAKLMLLPLGRVGNSLLRILWQLRAAARNPLLDGS